MTPDRREALDVLTQLQNHPLNASVDILTFTGFLSDAELPGYIAQQRAGLSYKQTLADDETLNRRIARRARRAA